MVTPEVIVFDMDGVLVEVAQSYWEAIVQTVAHFTGKTVSYDTIQDFKSAGGWNNDWALSQRLISDHGVTVAFGDVVTEFNRIFLGDNNNGLILREQWMPKPGLLERLAEKAALAIFTGRASYEADATLNKYAPHIRFEPMVTDESVVNHKPAPDGLEIIKNHYPGKTLWYLGDTVDDARSAQAADVPFIGVSMLFNSRHAEITASLRALGAFAVIQDINELEALCAKPL
jgi:HAD superfamily hydrolase (TIGR01548 family)